MLLFLLYFTLSCKGYQHVALDLDVNLKSTKMKNKFNIVSISQLEVDLKKMVLCGTLWYVATGIWEISLDFYFSKGVNILSRWESIWSVCGSNVSFYALSDKKSVRLFGTRVSPMTGIRQEG